MTARQVRVTIDREATTALYQQLADQLTAAIRSGELLPGDPFENEMSLAARLGLSRPTVRRAIQDLVDQGLLIRRRGLGTHVANRKVHRQVQLTSLFEDLTKEGRRPSTVVLGHTIGTNPAAATALGLPGSATLLRIRRLRLAGERPLALMSNCIPDPGLDITSDDLADQSLYELLRKRGMVPSVAEQEIGARMPTREEHRTLDLRGTQPLMTMTRVAFDASGTGIEWGAHVYAAADYTFKLRIHEHL